MLPAGAPVVVKPLNQDWILANVVQYLADKGK